ncbi:hypothetical protein L3Q82_017719 [Scortum barcoo]|uniref:Uncharacterized protein n=1 Tax=Scortum barcoo TaxID=214431 RepID=A0ACB8VLH7_9TELE|nr:hypothetical protein L3Q82_017719 [Scortum barcoo]
MLACGTPDAVDRYRQAKQAAARTVLEAKTSGLGGVRGRWKKYFEDLLNPTDLPSNEEAEDGDSEVDSSITQAEVTELEGLWEFCPTSPHVLCGSGEGIRPCPSWYSVGECSMISMGSGAFAKGCSVSVRPEQELGSHCRQGRRESRFGNHRISSLLFADDVVLLASSSQDLQHVLERFAAECEAAGMRISTSKSEAMVHRSTGKGGGALSGVNRTAVVKEGAESKGEALGLDLPVNLRFPPSPMVMNFG